MTKRTNILTVAFLLLFLGINNAVKSASKAQELVAVQNEIKSLAQKLEDQIGRKNAQQQKLRQIEKEIAEVEKATADTKKARMAANKKQQQLKSEEQLLENDVHRLANGLTGLVRAAYAMGNQPYLKLMLSQKDPGAVDRAMVYYRYLATARTERISLLNAKALNLREIKSKISTQQDELLQLSKRLEAQSVTLTRQRSSRDEQLAALNKAIKGSDRRVEKLKADERRLLGLVESLRQKRMQQKRLQASPDPQSSSKRTGSTSARRTSKAKFTQLKGKLPLPVSGKIQRRFGQKDGESGVASDGVLFSAREDAPVEAIYRGQVAYADWFRGFGLLLIIDHGNGFMSLYSHNKQLLSNIGDWVESGDAIASVGNSGGLDRPGLYFEIRQDGTPQDPLKWCRS